jgi:hypothetical protein
MLSFVRFAACLMLALLFSERSAAQTNDGGLDQFLQPTIAEIEFPEQMSTRMRKPISNKNEYFMESFDNTPISLERDHLTKAKLNVKGGASLNHIQIYDKNAAKDAFPLIDETFRGTGYKELDLSKLKDGEYRVKVIYAHSQVETILDLRTLGAN